MSAACGADQSRTIIAQISGMLSLGMSGDLITVLEEDAEHAERAAKAHGAPHWRGPWQPERPGLGTSITGQQPHILEQVADWAAKRPHLDPANRGIRFIALHLPAADSEGYVRSILYHSRHAGLHVISAQAPLAAASTAGTTR